MYKAMCEKCGRRPTACVAEGQSLCRVCVGDRKVDDVVAGVDRNDLPMPEEDLMVDLQELVDSAESPDLAEYVELVSGIRAGKYDATYEEMEEILDEADDSMFGEDWREMVLARRSGRLVLLPTMTGQVGELYTLDVRVATMLRPELALVRAVPKTTSYEAVFFNGYNISDVMAAIRGNGLEVWLRGYDEKHNYASMLAVKGTELGEVLCSEGRWLVRTGPRSVVCLSHADFADQFHLLGGVA